MRTGDADLAPRVKPTIQRLHFLIERDLLQLIELLTPYLRGLCWCFPLATGVNGHVT